MNQAHVEVIVEYGNTEVEVSEALRERIVEKERSWKSQKGGVARENVASLSRNPFLSESDPRLGRASKSR